MSDDSTAPRKGQPLLAWLVILAVVIFILVRNAMPTAQDSAARLVSMQAQARFLVGTYRAGFPSPGPEELLEQFKQTLGLDDDDSALHAKQLRLAILTGELLGPKEALRALDELEDQQRNQQTPPSESSLEAAALLKRLYQGYEAGDKTPALTEDEQTRLRDSLGWFGELALAPEDGDPDERSRVLAAAQRTTFAYFTILLGGTLGLLIGVTLLIVFFVLAFMGRLPGLTVSGRGGIYAETFAVYFVLYLILGASVRLLPQAWTSGLWLSGLAMILSLAALLWPVCRGVPWRLVREDLGIYAGKQPALEFVYGIGTYFSALPLLLVGIVLFVALVRSKLTSSMPTHPLLLSANEKGWWIWVQVFLVACVLAPIVEEIMFRGALYRHLREAGGAWSRWNSALFAALASSFLFAVIHPQGWLGVPILGGLAFVFALAREWRGSLLPAMVAHGINNGVTTLLLLASS